MWRVLAVVVLLGCGPAVLPTDDIRVVEVIDGDTIDVVIGGRTERVRLIGIDTPETHVEEGPPECYGPEASEFTARLLPTGSRVRLERDVVGRDDYGRLLAYVYRVSDDTMVNERIVRRGFATPLTIAPNEAHVVRFVTAAGAAESEGLGLWGACGG